MRMSRREFAQSAAVLAAAAGLGATARAARQPSPSGGPALPVAISSGNGIPAVNKAVERITAGDDPLDAVIAGVNIVEDDPNDKSVGLGGLPNEDGVVELDASVMHGPTHKAGAVASLQRIRNPSSVARLVMQRTDHVLLVGEGALRFARAHGFEEENLLTDESRRIWLKWKETRSDKDAWLHPEEDREWGRYIQDESVAGGRDAHPPHTWGTITCMAVTPGGDIGGCTTTSGLSYKLPGRVGDSPIIGAGLYVDNEVGACGSTGRGEANLQNCSSYLVVELMRGGMTPEEACLETLRRVMKKTERRLLREDGAPRYSLTMYALRKDGMFGGAALQRGAKMAVHDGTASRRVELPGLYDRQ